MTASDSARLNDAHCHFFSAGFFAALARDPAAPRVADPAVDLPAALGWEPPGDPAQLADRGDDGAGGSLGDVGGAQADDLDLLLRVRVGDPVVHAAPAKGLVQLTGTVGGEDHHRRLSGPERAGLGDRDLEVGEELQEERLELVVRAVDLVDEEQRARGSAQRGEQRALDQERLVVQVDVVLAGAAQREHLRGVVPLVERRRRVHALVALEPDEVAAEHLGERLARLGLAHPGRTFEQQRLAERKGEKCGGAETLAGDVCGTAKCRSESIRRIEATRGSGSMAKCRAARWERQRVRGGRRSRHRRRLGDRIE